MGIIRPPALSGGPPVAVLDLPYPHPRGVRALLEEDQVVGEFDISDGRSLEPDTDSDSEGAPERPRMVRAK
ncbi:hypothetical protein [Streptomyces sp. NBC_01264]|uniref:hypothetical protein n=1 Tax=Streptomyces sp. NBC_01264 TaxID=2903804 RepID=UPI002259E583|nr:hypothetical protein [Streptomyces sp. NBC_01264]MCX4784198.1 hypothetical protein [Streptomyces sp. NBC_01264]